MKKLVLLIILSSFTFVSCIENENKEEVYLTMDEKGSGEKKLVVSEEEFFKAIRKKDVKKARTLIENGVNVNAITIVDKSPQTALYIAVKKSDKDMVELLLSKEAKLSADLHELHTSIYNRNADIANLLVKAGANLNEQNIDGDTPFMAAMAEGLYDVATNIIVKGAKQDDRYIIIATVQNKPNVVKVLLENGANIHAEDPYGNTALRIAQDEGYNEVVEIIKAH